YDNSLKTHPSPQDEPLPFRVAETPPPPTKSIELDSSETYESLTVQEMTARPWVVLVVGFEVTDWCHKFALGTARDLAREFYRSGDKFLKEDGQKIIDALDGDFDNEYGYAQVQGCPHPENHVFDPAAEFEARENARELTSRAQQALSWLSTRERQVVLAQANGMTQQQIAEMLGISFESVNTYLDRAREKGRGQRRPSPVSRRKRKN
ncbi:MAG: sigma-70 family RNA polymerase sigma factor, partial [Armatimonadetes bacterium]|nr:sigma-70 family RNA polymerase sigma factor [Armatimonadota bacterium]